VLRGVRGGGMVGREGGRWREGGRRWQRVAKEASKQSGRSVVPVVEIPRPLVDSLDAEGADLALCMWEGHAPPLAEVLARVRSPRAVRVLIGPEGGLARGEVEAARARGWSTASDGPRVLRTATARQADDALLLRVFSPLPT